MTSTRKTLPPVPVKAPTELRPLFAAMAEIIETGEGVRGDPLDRKLTLRDLLDGGIANLRTPGNANGGLTPAKTAIDRSAPPPPSGFSADGSFFGMVNLTWDAPKYSNHAYTNIYRSETDNFANAQIVGREVGMFYSDKIRDDAIAIQDPTLLKGYYYWITFVSTSDVEGPPNSAKGTFAQPIPDAAYLLSQLSGKVNSSTLSQDLNTQINQIGSNTSAISAQQKTINGLSAEYSLRLDVNGYVMGFGAYNNGSTADFAVLADRFWIARPGVKGSAVNPFMVIDGKVYIDSAFIRDASIQEGKLGPITFGKIFDTAGNPVTTVGGKLKANYIEVDQLTALLAQLQYAYIDTANIKDMAVSSAKIGNAAVDTLKIAGNAVTVPLGMTGYGSIPTVYLTLNEPGLVFVMVMANCLAPGDTGVASFFVRATAGGQDGPEVGVSIPKDFSSSAVAFATFWLPAGTHACSGATRFDLSTRVVTTTGIFVMGIKR